jgi:hypothetical protein
VLLDMEKNKFNELFLQMSSATEFIEVAGTLFYRYTVAATTTITITATTIFTIFRGLIYLRLVFIQLSHNRSVMHRLKGVNTVQVQHSPNQQIFYWAINDQRDKRSQSYTQINVVPKPNS